MTIRFFFLLLFSTILVACQQEEKSETVYRTVPEVVKADAVAKEFEEWNHSEYHPEKVFDGWLAWGIESAIRL